MKKLSYGLLAFCSYVVAMPEPEFNQLRKTVFAAANQDYQLGIQRLDEILQQQSLQLTLEQHIRLLYSKAEYTYRTNDTNAAIALLAQTKALSLESKDPSILYSYHNINAMIFSNLGLYQPALRHYRQALEKAQFLSNNYYVKQTENNLALILTKQRQFSEAKRYFEKFYQYGIRTKDASVQAVALNNLGELALDEGNIKLAGELHRQVLALRQQHQLKHHYSWSYLNLAKVAKAENDWPAVMELAQQSLKLRTGLNEVEQIEPGLLLAEALAQLAQQDAAQTQLQQSLAIASRKQNAEWLLRAWQQQAELYRQRKPALALQAMQQALAAQQKLAEQRYDLSIAQSAAELGLISRETELEQSRRQHELQQQAAQAQQQRLWLGIGATLLILFLTCYFVLNIRRKNRALVQSLEQLQRTKRQLVEAEKMAALTSLVSGMAHQLNTPLGTVLTAVSCSNEQLRSLQQKLREKTLTASDLQLGLQENYELLQLAQLSTHRAADLVQRFKLIAAQFEQTAPEPLMLSQYLHDMMHSLLLSFHPKKPVQLRFEGPELTCITYPSQLNKVLSALTENALCHGLANTDNPQISLSWQLQSTGTPATTAQFLKLQFSDNGSGIAPDLATKIFDPFFSTKLGQGSLGLGLNIVFNTLQNLQGQIELSPPTPDQPGCTFLLTIPLDIRQSQDQQTTRTLNT